MYPSVLVGLANNPLLAPEEIPELLGRREQQLDVRITALRAALRAQQPVPGFVAAPFDYSAYWRECGDEVDEASPLTAEAPGQSRPSIHLDVMTRAD